MARQTRDAQLDDRTRGPIPGGFDRMMRWAAASAVLGLALLGGASEPPIQAQSACGPTINPIVCENMNPGDPASQWDIVGSGDPNLQGFAADISVAAGDRVDFKVQTNASGYSVNIYRMGYYGGMGARKVATLPSVLSPAAQPACLTEAATGLVDCGNWSVSTSWNVPTTAVSGIYFAHLQRLSGSGESHIVFVVREPATGPRADLLFQTSDTTWQAYNSYGGNSLYVGGPGTNPGRAYKVSYNRPFNTRGTVPHDFVFHAEYPMVRFLEANGYYVSYFTGVDTERLGARLLEHKAFLSVGHDEYWSAGQRSHVETARAAGVNLAFFSGNEVFWKTRWESSIDGSATAHRTLVSYKETHANAKIDPSGQWTGTWRDARFSPPADGGRPEHALTGTLFRVNEGSNAAIKVNDVEGKHRFWRNTTLATLAPGTTATLSANTIGYEWDVAPDDALRPGGLTLLSSTTVAASSVLQDQGSVYAPETVTHNLTLYKHGSGALVFGAGTVQWSWGLDGNHDVEGSTPDLRMQQATVNLFADMGAQPGTPQTGIVTSSGSSDLMPPTTLISSPGNGEMLAGSPTLTVDGTANDGGGGSVVGVEVSVDGGATWHLATGRQFWNYTWTPTVFGSTTILSRAIDDSGNIQTPGTSVTVTVVPSCPCTIWPDTAVPTKPAEDDLSEVELGVKFKPEMDGYITGIRYYKSFDNTGTHVGRLWTSTGTLISSATFTNETNIGWQTVTLPAPVPVTANTTYVASYRAPAGRYAADAEYFTASGVVNTPLQALRSGVEGGNGVYKYGSAVAFPNESYASTNYWVDVVFTTTVPDFVPPQVVAFSPTDGAAGVNVGVVLSATFNEAMNAGTSTVDTFELIDPGGNRVPAVVSYSSATKTAILVPSQPLAPSTVYLATVRGGASDPRFKDRAGNPLPASRTWSFTTALADGVPPSVTSRSPAQSTTGVSRNAPVTVTFSEAMNPATLTTSSFQLRDSFNISVPASVTYDAGLGTATLRPTSPLQAGGLYTATVAASVTDVSGNPMTGPVAWSFTVGQCPCTIWPESTVPGIPDSGDGSSVELGVKFRASTAGFITGIRFYKGGSNTGPHTGNLWTTTGTRLATVTFTDESATGWQQALFAAPVPIQANTTYIASYFAPTGGYAVEAGYFGTGFSVGPLSALAEGVDGPNGVYRASAGFPDSTFNLSNYWVDVVFDPSAQGGAGPSVLSVTPAAGALAVSTSTLISATFDRNIAPTTLSSTTFEVRDAANILVSGDLTYDPATRTATFSPHEPLFPGMMYVVRLAGGTVGLRIRDDSGQALAATVAWTFSTSDSTPPTIMSATPAAGATNVSVNASTSVVFSEPMDQATIDATTLQLHGAGGALVPAAIVYVPGARVATIDPMGPLAASTTYTATVNGGATDPRVKDASGNALAATFTLSFTTGTLADSTQPAVASVSPAPSATDVALDTLVRATFSEAMNPGTLVANTFEVRDGAGVAVPGVIAYDGASLTATFTPSSPLLGQSVYVATIKGGFSDPRVKDTAGNSLAAPYSWEFVTGGVDSVPPGTAAKSPAPDATGINTNSNVSVVFTEPMNPSTITASTFLVNGPGGPVAGAVLYDALTRTATFNPTATLASSTAYTVTIKGGLAAPVAQDLAGNALSADATWSFTTGACPCTIFPANAVPEIVDSGDSSSLAVGVKFRPLVNGFITGMRFYKSAANGGLHIGNLWTSDGVLLARANFTAESASGWQDVTFSPAVPVTANSIYVASYYMFEGRYSVTAGGFNTQSYINANATLEAPATTQVPGGNGVFVYNEGNAFPTGTFNGGNYFVDVVFDTGVEDTVAPAVISVTPSAGSTTAAPNGSVVATFSEGLDPATVNASTFELRTAGGALVPSTLAYDALNKTASLTPSAVLPSLETFTATIAGGGSGGILDLAGNALPATVTWSFTTADTQAPAVTLQSPAPGAAAVALGASVVTTFSEAMNPATLAGAFELRTSANALVPVTTSYNAAARTLTAIPTGGLATATIYTATIKGGAAGAKDTAGNALSGNVNWTFSTSGAVTVPNPCPCTIFPAGNQGAPADQDSAPIELGVKFRADVNGYITALRFYMATNERGTYIGSLWTTTGARLARVEYPDATSIGWHEVTLPTPIPVSAGTTYIVSYFTSVGRYAAVGGQFVSGGLNNPPLRVLAHGAEGGNGVFKQGSNSFPDQSFNGANYFADVVFNTTVPADVTAPSVLSTMPTGTVNGPLKPTVRATFSESIAPATLTAATVELRDVSNALVPVTLEYDAASRVLVLRPDTTLPAGDYTATLKGGDTGAVIRDLAGLALPASVSWSFTLRELPSPDEGPGGSILLITDPDNAFTRYYAEILRAEGLNQFAVVDRGFISPALLSAYDVVLLAEMTLSPSDVTMYSDWVTAGGNLIAMRPDGQLASLLGLTPDAVSPPLSNTYLAIRTTSGPGVGLVNGTIQFHGTADRYTLNAGTTSVATLYNNATSATTHPAVSLRTVGTGQAAAFTFDLAKSVVLTRQGNPAWAGQERDGLAPIRSNDLFFGNAAADPQPDWVDFNKIAIPQADEQQRLLANMVIQMGLDKKPLPRFWYFPNGHKAVVVMTGDDHANNGTTPRFNQYKALSTPGCSVDDWECIRGTSYVYTGTPLTNNAAAAYEAEGFEIGLHVTTSCGDFTPTSFETTMSSQLSVFANVYSSVPKPTTNRNHCIVWSDYTSGAQVSYNNGIRLDTNYYYWPAMWVNNRPGLFTGSGMPMRFATAQGKMIDVYQAATQFTDESAQTFPFNSDAVLGKAIGPEGYYGAFTANMHTDALESEGSNGILDSARRLGVPVVTARQMLTWLDGRNSSSFASVGWNGSVLSFAVIAGEGARGLQGMLPLQAASGWLIAIVRDGQPVVFGTQTIKGITYAMFAAEPGLYQAVYDNSAPQTTITTKPPVTDNRTTTTFGFTSSEPGSTFSCRLDTAAFAPCVSPVTYNNLTVASHTFQVRATDASGNLDATPAAHTWKIDVVVPTLTTMTPAPDAVQVSNVAVVTVGFSEPMSAASFTSSSFRLRAVGAATDVPATIAVGGSTAILTPATPLLLNTTYQVTLLRTVSDPGGNQLGSDTLWTFTTIVNLGDTTSADFASGTVTGGALVADADDGEVILNSARGAEFFGTALPTGWTSTNIVVNGTGSVGTGVISNGVIALNGRRLSASSLFTRGTGRVVEFAATFSGDNEQHAGWGNTFTSAPWAIFSSRVGGGLYVRTAVNSFTEIDTLIPGEWFGASHVFRIEWLPNNVIYWIDGVQVASHALNITANMRPVFQDTLWEGTTLNVDWVRMTPHTTPGTFTSRVLDAGASRAWTTATWEAGLPTGTAVTVSVRFGNTATPDATWTAFTALSGPNAAISATSRYVQYQVVLSTTVTTQTPVFKSIIFGD